MVRRSTKSSKLDFSSKIQLAISYVECANRDVKDIEILIQNESFQNSIFLLQQSVEKAQKADLILNATWDTNWEVNEIIGHDTKNKTVKSIRKASELWERHILDCNFLSLPDKPLKNILLEEIKIKYSCGLISNYDIATLTEEIINEIIDLQDVIINVWQSYYNTKFIELSSKTDDLQLIKLYWIDKNELIESIKMVAFFDYAGIITYPHNQNPRYPFVLNDNNARQLKPEDYNENLGIIKLIPRIVGQLKIVLKNLERECAILIKEDDEARNLTDDERIKNNNDTIDRLLKYNNYNI